MKTRFFAFAIAVCLAAAMTTACQRSYAASDYIVIRGERYSISLTTMKLDNKGLQDKDLAPLQYMTNLTSLDLSNAAVGINENNITDLSPLSDLTNLTELRLNGLQISDLTLLSELTNLESLWLGGNQISDISPLSS